MCRHASERGDLRVALVGPSEQADRADTEVARLTIIFYLSGCVFVVVSNSQFNLMKDMSDTTKLKEQCHAMVHKLQYD